MEAKQWTFVDKSAWGEGPWQNEPDKMQWTDEATGLPCLIHRSYTTGALCGYVGVAEGHPAFEKHYDEHELDVHGGLTFCDFCADEVREDGSGICHVAGEGEPDRVWWLGFDCGHCDDLVPGMNARLIELGGNPLCWGVYRELGYVQQQCMELARQLKGLE